MTDNRDHVHDAELDALLAEAGRAPPPPLPLGLQSRLIADAAAVQAGRRGSLRPAAGWPARWLAWLRAALADLGGAPGLAGLSAAGLAGLWIGLADPIPGTPVATLIQEGTVGLLDGFSLSAGLVDAALDSPFDDFDALY